MYSIGELIREARGQRGWGQRRLAEVSGVSQPNVAAIEAGHRVPSLAMVRRLIAACGLQVRFDLEPQYRDVNSRIEAAWERDAIGRPVRSAFDTLSSAARLARVGTRLVVDGPLAACLQGAPVGEPVERIWCDPAHAEQLRAASVRIHRDFRPVWRRDHGDDCSLSEGDQVDIGDCRVTLGPLPPAVWAVDMFGEALPVVGVDTLLGYPHWTPAERVAVRRLAAMLAEHGEASHGLDPVDTPR